MKETIRNVEDIVQNKIDTIDALLKEIEESDQALRVSYNIVAEIAVKMSSEEDLKSLESKEEFVLYQEQTFRNTLLKEEATRLLKDVFSIYKVLDLLGEEISEKLLELKDRDYIKEAKEPQNIFVLKKGILEEREKGLYKKELMKALEFVKKEEDAVGGNISSD